MSQGPCLSSGRITPVPTHPIIHSFSHLPASQINSRPWQAHTLVPMPALFPQLSGPGGNKLSPPAASHGLCLLSVERWLRVWGGGPILRGLVYSFSYYIVCVCLISRVIRAPCICHPLEHRYKGLWATGRCWELNPDPLPSQRRIVSPAPRVAGVPVFGAGRVFPTPHLFFFLVLF